MKKTADYRASYQAERLLFEHVPKDILLSERTWQLFEQTKASVAAQEAQFVNVKNQERWNQLADGFYPCLCEMAQLQGGCVELDINEETLLGQLLYTGDTLIVDNTLTTNLDVFSRMAAASSGIFLTVQDGSFTLQFVFHLYDKQRAAHHAAEDEPHP